MLSRRGKQLKMARVNRNFILEGRIKNHRKEGLLYYEKNQEKYAMLRKLLNVL